MPEATGVIHDIGYQGYTGPRLGRRYATRSLFVHSLRTAYGLGRGAKSKVFPWLVAGLAFAVALVAVAVRAQGADAILTYTGFCDAVGLPLLLFIAVIAPELVSRDLRAHVLPLYFSRPLSRSDYALAKLASAISAIWLMLAAPLLLMLVGGLFSQTGGFSGAMREVRDFGGGVAYAAVYALVYASVAVLVASLVGRRAVAAAMIVATFLITTPIVGVLEAVGNDAVRKVAPILNPVTMIEGIREAIDPKMHSDIGGYGPLYIAAATLLVAVCTALLVVRYRRVSQ